MASDQKKGALDGVSINTLRAQKKAAEEKKNAEVAEKENTTETTEKVEPVQKKEEESTGAVFSWDDEKNAEASDDVPAPEIPSISDLKKAAEDSTPTPVQPVSGKKEPTKEELGGGIVIDNPEVRQNNGVMVEGPAGKNSEAMKGAEERLKELDEMTKIAAVRAAATGEKQKAQTVVQIIMDKTGMNKVEFTDEERSKLSAARKIKVTEIQDESLSHIQMSRPKALNQKHIIQRTFSKQFAPFVAAASGYLGKMRNLSSLEVINLVTINTRTKNSADALHQKASLIYTKLHEASVGEFPSFDEFAKNTALVDLDVMLYGLIRATYPDDETILMNCGNPKCTHKQRNRQTGEITDVPNQFQHRYRNTELLLVDKISDKLRDAAENIDKASHTVEDAKEEQKKAPLFQTHRYAFGDDNEILIDIYCPSIYEAIENISKKFDVSDYRNNEAYETALALTTFIKQICLKDTESDDPNKYNVFDDVLTMIDIVYNFDEEMLKVVQQLIVDNVNTYQYTYGFKAESVVCPHCGHAFEEDVETDMQYLLFLQAQRHMTND